MADFASIISKTYSLNHPYIDKEVVASLVSHATEHYLDGGKRTLDFATFESIMLDHPLIVDCFQMEW